MTVEKERRLSFEGKGYDSLEALCFGTSNTARALEIERKKGHIAPGVDADLLLMDEDLTMNTVIAGGQIMMENHVLLKKGTYEAE